MDAFRVGLDLACGEKLVYESLCGIAGGCSEGFLVGGGGDGVWIVGEEVAEVECEGRGLVDGDGSGMR